MADFAQTITTAYAVDGTALDLGRGVHDGAVFPDAPVKLPLRMVNRHGLIAGATGTGKTKTLQGLAEQLSSAGVPVFVADVEGDLSGIAEPGDASGAAGKRARELGLQFQARGFPVEFFALGGIGPGIPVRASSTTWRHCSPAWASARRRSRSCLTLASRHRSCTPG